MKTPEQNKRPRRTPLTREEVEAVIEFKRRKELRQLLELKSTWSYKMRNVFIVICFFIFCEVLVCYFGACKHRLHYTQFVSGNFAPYSIKEKSQKLSELEAICVDGTFFKLLVDDFKKIPPRYTQIDVCSDFIMNCELKARVAEYDDYYRLFRANPVLLLCVCNIIIILFGIYHNLNQIDYTLWGLSIISAMTLLFLACI